MAAQLLYVAPSRDLDRLTSRARSPTVSIFKEAISGAPFIRAAGNVYRHTFKSHQRTQPPLSTVGTVSCC
eukprot:7192646-Pyramimonas_sp.AAC.1